MLLARYNIIPQDGSGPTCFRGVSRNYPRLAHQPRKHGTGGMLLACYNITPQDGWVPCFWPATTSPHKPAAGQHAFAVSAEITRPLAQDDTPRLHTELANLARSAIHVAVVHEFTSKSKFAKRAIPFANLPSLQTWLAVASFLTVTVSQRHPWVR